MFKSKFSKIAAALALSLGSIAGAQAVVIQAGEFKMTIDAYDSATTQYFQTCTDVASCNTSAASLAPGSIGSVNPSSDTMGIFSIATISRNVGGIDQDWYTRGANGEYLTGIFGNLSDYNVDFSGDNTLTKASGGTISLWLNTGNYSRAPGPAVTAVTDLNAGLYPGISGGTLVLQGLFVSGIIADDTATTFATDFNSTTLFGSSAGYIDIIGGRADFVEAFDTGLQFDENGVGRDLYADFVFSPRINQAASNGWTVGATGSIVGNVVPEPGALALLGLGLVGVAAARRNKKSA